MAGATFYWECWLVASTATNDLSFISSVPPRADSFPWFKAILVFFLAEIIVLLVCNAFNILTNTFRGTAIWLPSTFLLTLALLWLFGLITGGTILRILIWVLYGIAGILILSLILNSVIFLMEWKSKRSKGQSGK